MATMKTGPNGPNGPAGTTGTTIQGDILNAPDAEIVCFCSQTSKGTLQGLIRDGVDSLEALKHSIGATGTECAERSPRGRCCTPEIVRLLRHAKGMLPMG